MTTPALSTPAANAPFETTTIQRRDLRDNDVLIDIAYAGICHSDIHQAREEWGDAIFPMVPGHEIAGTISKVGSAVSSHQVGDRVGVGCMVDSCGSCEMCKGGNEQFCAEGAVMTYNSRYPDGEETLGGYSQQIVVPEHFVCRIPDGIELDVAAPLLCAGITTYAPLKRWGAGPNTRVGVVGMGGLGHMGVKIAAAMGAEVTVLSRTTAKAEDSRELGASDHVATEDPEALKRLRGSFDLILNTVSADLDMETYLKLLKPTGVMCNVGMPTGRYQVQPSLVVGGQKVLAGSLIGGIPETQEMLEFCAEHHLGATIQTISADEVDEAYDKVVDGAVRYRYVIDTATIGAKG